MSTEKWHWDWEKLALKELGWTETTVIEVLAYSDRWQSIAVLRNVGRPKKVWYGWVDRGYVVSGGSYLSFGMTKMTSNIVFQRVLNLNLNLNLSTNVEKKSWQKLMSEKSSTHKFWLEATLYKITTAIITTIIAVWTNQRRCIWEQSNECKCKIRTQQYEYFWNTIQSWYKCNGLREVKKIVLWAIIEYPEIARKLRENCAGTSENSENSEEIARFCRDFSPETLGRNQEKLLRLAFSAGIDLLPEQQDQFMTSRVTT